MEEELMMEAWCLLKNEKEGGLLPLPAFPLIIKESFQGVALSHPDGL